MNRAQTQHINWKPIFFLIVGVLLFLVFASVQAQNAVYGPNVLEDIAIQPLSGNKVQIAFKFACPLADPKGFSVDSPSSVVFDFPNTKNKLPREAMNQSLAVGNIRGINVVEANGKTRAVIKVKQVTPFETEVCDNVVMVTVQGGLDGNIFDAEDCMNCYAHYGITGVDFKRGDAGSGKIIVKLSTSKAPIDFKEERGKLVAYFVNAELPPCFERKYDVTDFGTPAQYFVVERKNNMVKLEVVTKGDFDKIAYQMDDEFIIETRFITHEEKLLQTELAGNFTGERLSLNFQDIDIRAVLQMLADFAGFNLVTNDQVHGNITLRLQNVPWDQALDIILKTKGLDQRIKGNVRVIGPTDALAKIDKLELENIKSIQELGQLHSELIQINYAKAEDLATMIKEKTNSLLTSRGSVTYDKRTNTLLLQDIESKIAEIKGLVRKLDRPTRQVEISTQIITSDDRVEQTLGLRFGGGANAAFGGRRRVGIGAGIDQSRAIADFPGKVMPPSNAVISQAHMVGADLGPTVQNTEGLFSDLFAAPSALINPVNIARVGFSLAYLPANTLLDLELQALEAENKTKTIARPKIMTLDKVKASVETGTQIPYNQASSSGATSISFQEAVLKLEVTPQITPDNRVIMDINISNDSPGVAVPTGQQAGATAIAINTNKLTTQVLVDNGETVVLGGIMQIIETKTRVKVPLFGDIPIIGNIFRNKDFLVEKKELLIFITPKIIEEPIDP